MTDIGFTPAYTNELLQKLGHTPNKQLGQNFLVDKNILKKSIEMAELSAGETIVEVGPGLGCLSDAMLKTGCKVYAVERDPKLAEHLRQSYANNENFDLLEDDALKSPRAKLPEDVKTFKVVANLPYAISTPWLSALIEQEPLPECMVLMLQKEAGERFSAKAGTKNFGAISIFLNAAYETENIHKVSKYCFKPEPKVDSVLIKFTLKEDAKFFKDGTRKLIRNIFTQRRKQLGSLCKNFASTYELGEWFDSLSKHGFSQKSRPEEIPMELWLELDAFIN